MANFIRGHPFAAVFFPSLFLLLGLLVQRFDVGLLVACGVNMVCGLPCISLIVISLSLLLCSFLSPIIGLNYTNILRGMCTFQGTQVAGSNDSEQRLLHIFVHINISSAGSLSS